MKAALTKLTPDEVMQLRYYWPLFARDKQLPPQGEWQTWVILAGRGFGKTRTGVEWVRTVVERGLGKRGALVAPTAADCRDVMIEGESGILNTSPPWFMPRYEPSKRRLTWPNKAQATLFSSDEPRQLRGPQFDFAWCDEFCHWRFVEETFDNLQFALRHGNPKQVVTTTPKPIKPLIDLLARPNVVVTKGTSYENRANLAAAYFDNIISKYEGTRLGRQELNAELLGDAEGALWTREIVERTRVSSIPTIVRVIVGVDPATTSNALSNQTGIVVCGLGDNGHGYLLDDKSLRGSPMEWANEAVAVYNKYQANLMVAETNQGGELVRQTIQTVDETVAYRGVHAKKGKMVRAEPVAALYEQGRIHHLGMFAELEDQLCQWAPGDVSPDRLDAMVYAFTELMLDKEKSRKVVTF